MDVRTKREVNILAILSLILLIGSYFYYFIVAGGFSLQNFTLAILGFMIMQLGSLLGSIVAVCKRAYALTYTALIAAIVMIVSEIIVTGIMILILLQIHN